MNGSENTFLRTLIAVSIGGGFSILGTWLGYILNRKNSINTIRTHEVIKAGNKLKHAFSNTKELVANGYLLEPFLKRLYDREIPRQENAFIEFAAYLTDGRRHDFRRAWQEYKCQDKEAFLRKYKIVEGRYPEGGTQEEKREQDEIQNKESIKLILCQIDKVLHFTDPKFVFKE